MTIKKRLTFGIGQNKHATWEVDRRTPRAWTVCRGYVFLFVFNWKMEIVTVLLFSAVLQFGPTSVKMCVFVGAAAADPGHKALAVALFSRWEEGDKALSRHAWLVLQESVARTERAKKTTWWHWNSSDRWPEARRKTQSREVGGGRGECSPVERPISTPCPPKTLLAPPGAAPSLTRVRGKHHEPPFVTPNTPHHVSLVFIVLEASG